ncbi:MAG TPA: DUF4190 domain-containing protein [Kofleriaceae bacterium]|jgi:hypothetical protein|nr:DUF4190 domain-containing protein [Kofleriaceae bacterium]
MSYPPPPGPPPQGPYPPPPPYPYYPPPYGYPPPARTNGYAIASMVLGIVWFYWITSILAVVFGHIAISQINRSRGALTGKGMAIAGLVLGYVWLGFLVLGILIAAAGTKVHL